MLESAVFFVTATVNVMIVRYQQILTYILLDELHKPN